MLAVAMVTSLATATTITSYADESNTRGTIYFDSTNLYGATSDGSKNMYCYTWSSTDGQAFAWDTSGCKMTNIGEHLYSYDVPSVNKEGKSINVDLMIFHASIGKQTWDTTFNDSCIGDTAYVSGDLYETFPLEDSGSMPACSWRNNPSMGAHITINYTGKVFGWSLLENETPESVVDAFIENYTQGMEEGKIGYDNPDLVTNENRIALITRINEILDAHSEELPPAPTEPTEPPIDAGPHPWDSISFEIPESFIASDNKYYVHLWDSSKEDENLYEWESKGELMTIVNEPKTLALYTMPDGEWDMMIVSNSDGKHTFNSVIDSSFIGKTFTVEKNNYGIQSMQEVFEVVWKESSNLGLINDYYSTHREIIFDDKITVIGSAYLPNETDQTIFDEFKNKYGKKSDGSCYWDESMSAKYNMSWEEAEKHVAELLGCANSDEEPTEKPTQTPTEAPTSAPTSATSSSTTAPTSATTTGTNNGKGTVNTSQSSAVATVGLVFIASLGVVVLADKKRKQLS